MKKNIGTRSWAAASNGALQNVDRKRLMAQIMLGRLALMPKRLRAWIGLNDPVLAKIDIDAIRIPDSSAARQAGELAGSLSPPWMFNHCIRTYLWGAMLAQTRQIKFDEELFYVASALHDLGLTEQHRCGAKCAACFAVEGARAAEQFADTVGWPGERRDRLSEAISLHLNIRVGLAHGPEAHLLHAGASVDVIGARLKEIDMAGVRHVLDHYPRLGFNTEMAALMKDEARSKPDSRAAFLIGLGFSRMIRESKWPA